MDSEDIEEVWSGFKSMTTDAVSAVCPVERKRTKAWISDRSLRIRDRRRGETNKKTRNFLHRELARSLRLDVDAWWADRAGALQHASNRGDSRTLFRIVNELAGHQPAPLPSTILDKDGNRVSDARPRLTRWAQHFEDLLNRPGPTQPADVAVNLPLPGEQPIDETVPNLNEVRKAVQSLKSRKSPGACDIPAEALHALDDNSLALLSHLISLIWQQRQVPEDMRKSIIVPIFKKGRKADCANYRGISLLSIAGKVLTTILRHRMQHHYERKLRERQGGFRKGRGCIDQIFALRQVLERQIRYGKPTVICFIDFAAAFDSVHRDSMWKILKNCGLPNIFVDILKNLYDGSTSCVRTQDGLSPPFPVKTGVRQGCILSPLLFNLVLDWVLAKAIDDGADGVVVGDGCTVADLDYADDIALLQPDSASMQALLDRMADHAEHVGLKIKPAKTKVIALNSPPPELHVYGEAIEVVDAFCYLGSTISGRTIAPNEDIACRIGKASTTFRRLSVRLWRRSDITIETKMKIFNASIVPVLLYGCETWSPLSANLNNLEVFHMSCLRTILGVSLHDRLSNQNIRRLCCNQQTIQDRLRQSRLRWLGHVARMPDDRLCSQVWCMPAPVNWRCVRSAPRRTWLSTVLSDLSHLKDTYGAAWWARCSTQIIKDAALDRAQWRRLIMRGNPTAVGDD